MKKQWWIPGFVLLALIATVVVVFNLPPKEPVYQGRRLTSWVEDLEHAAFGSEKHQAASEAVKHIGTNAVPTLLQMLRVDSPVKLKLNALLKKQSFIKFRFAAADQARYHRAVLACYTLGPDARPATPALIRLLNKGPVGSLAWAGIGPALAQIGPEAVPPLIATLANTNFRVRTEAVFSLERFASLNKGNRDAPWPEMVRALVKATHDQSPGVRNVALSALGEIKEQAAISVPAVVARLDHRDFLTRWYACIALGTLDGSATNAVPALMKRLEDEDRRVPGAAAIALVQIQHQDVSHLDAILSLLIDNLEARPAWENSSSVRFRTVKVIGLLGPMARSAVPALLDLAKHQRSDIPREAVLVALKQIDPEAAANAGLE